MIMDASYSVPYKMASSTLSWIRVGQKGCASSTFHSFIYEVCVSYYVGFSVTTHPVGGLSILHIQEKFP